MSGLESSSGLTWLDMRGDQHAAAKKKFRKPGRAIIAHAGAVRRFQSSWLYMVPVFLLPVVGVCLRDGRVWVWNIMA